MAEISIIIPAYNAEAFLAQTIESVLAQTYRAWELVILDDGSQDGTLALAQQYARQDSRVQVHTQVNSGVAVTRNNGIKLLDPATCYVLFLDHDDFLEADALSQLHAHLKDAPDAVAVYGLPREVDATGEAITRSLCTAEGFRRPTVSPSKKLSLLAAEVPDSFSNLVVWPSVKTPGQMLIRLSALKRAGLFDPETAPSDDWDLTIRLSLLGPIYRVLKFTINKRNHRNNLSKQGKVMASAEPRIRRKLATNTLLTEAQKQCARLGHQYSCWYKLSWSKEELRRCDFIAAAKTIYRALRSYIAYLKTAHSY